MIMRTVLIREDARRRLAPSLFRRRSGDCCARPGCPPPPTAEQQGATRCGSLHASCRRPSWFGVRPRLEDGEAKHDQLRPEHAQKDTCSRAVTGIEWGHRSSPQAAMPHILVHVPKASFPGDARSSLVHRINDAAARAERISDDPRKRVMCWVVIDEVDSGRGWRRADALQRVGDSRKGRKILGLLHTLQSRRWPRPLSSRCIRRAPSLMERLAALGVLN